MKPKPRPITKQSFQTFEDLEGWAPIEIPRERWQEMDFLPRPDDLLAVFASGCAASAAEMHGLCVNAGMDVIVVEQDPKTGSPYGPEPCINIYHMVFQELDRDYDEFRYLAYGPFNVGALQDHWPMDEEAALDFYCTLGGRLPEGCDTAADDHE